MHQNSNTIKTIFLIVFLYFPTQTIAFCPGCLPVQVPLEAALLTIDATHQTLETTVDTYHQTVIQPLLDDIKQLQNDITTINVRMVHLEKEANMHDKELLFMLKKNLKHLLVKSGGSL